MVRRLLYTTYSSVRRTGRSALNLFWYTEGFFHQIVQRSPNASVAKRNFANLDLWYMFRILSVGTRYSRTAALGSFTDSALIPSEDNGYAGHYNGQSLWNILSLEMSETALVWYTRVPTHSNPADAPSRPPLIPSAENFNAQVVSCRTLQMNLSSGSVGALLGYFRDWGSAWDLVHYTGFVKAELAWHLNAGTTWRSMPHILIQKVESLFIVVCRCDFDMTANAELRCRMGVSSVTLAAILAEMNLGLRWFSKFSLPFLIHLVWVLCFYLGWW